MSCLQWLGGQTQPLLPTHSPAPCGCHPSGSSVLQRGSEPSSSPVLTAMTAAMSLKGEGTCHQEPNWARILRTLHARGTRRVSGATGRRRRSHLGMPLDLILHPKWTGCPWLRALRAGRCSEGSLRWASVLAKDLQTLQAEALSVLPLLCLPAGGGMRARVPCHTDRPGPCLPPSGLC